MPSIIFYDPDGYHHRQPSNDPDILFSRNPQDLNQLAVLTNNHPLPILCFCGPYPMGIIGQLQNVLIYVCTFHRGYVNLGNDNGFIRENVVFGANTDWKFKIVLDRIQLARTNRIQGSIRTDLQILRNIIQ